MFAVGLHLLCSSATRRDVFDAKQKSRNLRENISIGYDLGEKNLYQIHSFIVHTSFSCILSCSRVCWTLLKGALFSDRV